MRSHQLTGSTLVAAALLLAATAARADDGPSYPRINMLIWGAASPAWYAEFDWVITGWGDTEAIAAAKELNPELWATGTLDVNCCNRFGPDGKTCPSEWSLDHPNGDPVYAYANGCLLGDTSEFSGLFEGETFRQRVVSHGVEKMANGFDGWNSDGLWADCPWIGELDVDGDGDHTGADDEAWKQGRLALLSELRQNLGPDAIITAWAGAAESYWDEGPTYLNGVGVEQYLLFNHWDHVDKVYQQYYESAVEPHAFYINNSFDADPTPGSHSKNNFRFMRFGLGSTLMRDGYYSYVDNEDSVNNGHIWVRYYDEYDVPLGYPLGDFVTIRDHVYCRFFDGGVMILNATMHDELVTEDDLKTAAASLSLDWNTIAGEDGHYYRFAGQQDPGFNDGSQFDEILLPSQEIGFKRPRGESILLVRSPERVVMAAVIIDTQSFVTSPAAENATIDGFYGSCGDKTKGFRTGYGACSSSNPLWGYVEAEPADGRSVTFEAQLQHEGEYRVYEYHPEMDPNQVPHTIVHADGDQIVQVDQSVAAEQWNLLGTFHFTPGTPAQVIIASDPLATSAADAIRFEHVSCGDGVLDEGETCDGEDLGGASCTELGWDAGVLACAANCQGFDETGCSNGTGGGGAGAGGGGAGAGGGSAQPVVSGDTDEGCGCRVGAARTPSGLLVVVALLSLLGLGRRREGRRG